MDQFRCAVRSLAGISIVLGGCASTPPRPALLNHMVLVKLKDTEQAVALQRDSESRLSRIPQVRSLHIGQHVDVGRGNIDSDYSVAISVGFNSAKDYEAYLAHPEHLALLKEWTDRCAWIRIHDVLDPTP